MPTNVGFAAKYAWRLGEKDSEIQEAGKAIWYLRRQLVLRYHENNLEHDFRWFASSRIGAALASGKLTQDRADILVELVNYCLDGADRHLSHAIGIFETYTEEDHADHQQ